MKELSKKVKKALEVYKNLELGGIMDRVDLTITDRLILSQMFIDNKIDEKTFAAFTLLPGGTGIGTTEMKKKWAKERPFITKL